MSLGENTSRLVCIVDQKTRKEIEAIAKKQKRSISSVTAEILEFAVKKEKL